MHDAIADTIPAPNIHAETIGSELEREALRFNSAVNLAYLAGNEPEFYRLSGVVEGYRGAAEHVRKAGSSE